MAELTLALVLFTDAAGADLAVLRRTVAVPTRLLLVGLSLTILLGFGVAALFFRQLSFLELALLVTLLAPPECGKRLERWYPRTDSVRVFNPCDGKGW